MKEKENRQNKRSVALKCVWTAIYKKIEETLPENVMREWVDHFELIDLSMQKAVILMIGNADLNQFESLYYNDFADCLCSVIGYDVTIRFKQKRVKSPHSRLALRRLGLLLASLVLVALASLLVVVGLSAVRNLNFQETFYQVSSGKITGNLRIVQLSDLHDTVFDRDNNELVRRIKLLEPDVIVMTGDMIDQNDAGWDVTVDLCGHLTEVAPVYYIYGNNECSRLYDNQMTLESLDKMLGMSDGSRDAGWFRDQQDSLCTALEAEGVRVLLNESDTIEVAGNTIDIYGVLISNPSAFWPYAEESFSSFLYDVPGNFKLMLCHEPYVFQEFESEYWGDLALCGHTHGGVIRIPRLGGLYEHEGGLLPERQGAFIRGEYSANGTPLIVSSGLTNRNMIRVNNQPELVIVDVNRY